MRRRLALILVVALAVGCTPTDQVEVRRVPTTPTTTTGPGEALTPRGSGTVSRGGVADAYWPSLTLLIMDGRWDRTCVEFQTEYLDDIVLTLQAASRDNWQLTTVEALVTVGMIVGMRCPEMTEMFLDEIWVFFPETVGHQVAGLFMRVNNYLGFE